MSPPFWEQVPSFFPSPPPSSSLPPPPRPPFRKQVPFSDNSARNPFLSPPSSPIYVLHSNFPLKTRPSGDDSLSSRTTEIGDPSLSPLHQQNCMGIEFSQTERRPPLIQIKTILFFLQKKIIAFPNPSFSEEGDRPGDSGSLSFRSPFSPFSEKELLPSLSRKIRMVPLPSPPLSKCEVSPFSVRITAFLYELPSLPPLYVKEECSSFFIFPVLTGVSPGTQRVRESLPPTLFPLGRSLSFANSKARRHRYPLPSLPRRGHLLLKPKIDLLGFFFLTDFAWRRDEGTLLTSFPPHPQPPPPLKGIPPLFFFELLSLLPELASLYFPPPPLDA